MQFQITIKPRRLQKIQVQPNPLKKKVSKVQVTQPVQILVLVTAVTQVPQPIIALLPITAPVPARVPLPAIILLAKSIIYTGTAAEIKSSTIISRAKL